MQNLWPTVDCPLTFLFFFFFYRQVARVYNIDSNDKVKIRAQENREMYTQERKSVHYPHILECRLI